MVVVLPQPFDPTKPKISPFGMVKETSSTAVKLPNFLVRLFASMAEPSSDAILGGVVKHGDVSVFYGCPAGFFF